MKVKVKVKIKREKKEIQITGDFIKLEAFLKFADIAQTGGHAKILIQNGEVLVNREVCTQRGRKLWDGDVITMDKTDYVISSQEAE